MKQPIVSTLQQDYSPLRQQDNCSLHCTLKCRQGKLFEKLPHEAKQPQLLLLKSEQWLAECLKRSPVQLVCLDSGIGEAGLRLWVDACEQAKKPVFLQIPVTKALLKQQSQISWWCKRLFNWITSAAYCCS